MSIIGKLVEGAEYDVVYSRISELLGFSPEIFSGNISRQLKKEDLNLLRGHKFWACDKSASAERVLLLCENESVYLYRKVEDRLRIDSFECGTENGQVDLPVKGFPKQIHQKTMLDGELVYNFRYEKPCFMIHDAIWVNGKNVSQMPLSQRLSMIGAYVTGPIRQKYPNVDDEFFYPFVIMGKEVFEFPHVSELISYSKYFTDELGPRFVYERNRRYYDTEGLYFMRESTPYNPHSILHWKYAEISTVLFSLNIRYNNDNDPTFQVSIRVPDQTMLIYYRNIKFNQDQSNEILSQLNGDLEGVIGCRFDDKLSEWVFVFVSKELTEVSDMTTVMLHLEMVASSVKQSDIEKCAQAILATTRNYNTQPRERIQVSPDNYQGSPMVMTPENNSHSSPSNNSNNNNNNSNNSNNFENNSKRDRGTIEIFQHDSIKKRKMDDNII